MALSIAPEKVYKQEVMGKWKIPAKTIHQIIKKILNVIRASKKIFKTN